MIKAIFFVMLLGFAHVNVYANVCGTGKDAPASVLTEFINKEFNGDVDSRMIFAAYKVNGKWLYDSLLNEGSMPGVIISLLGDPVNVVFDYKIECIFVEQKTAKMSVSFNTIATTTGFGVPERTLIKSDKRTEKIEYTLQLFDGMWKLVNPPIPRVSLNALFSAYARDVASMEKIINIPNSKASDSQRKNYSSILAEKNKIESWRLNVN